jgi:hypothetical protein
MEECVHMIQMPPLPAKDNRGITLEQKMEECVHMIQMPPLPAEDNKGHNSRTKDGRMCP